MISARITSNREPDRVVTMLALTQMERIQLHALLDRILEDVRGDKYSYRVGCPDDPQFGRLVRDGFDITELTLETERIANEFRRRL
jgi:hypothetical protein